ncbi:hypothetical protein MLD38_018018 [Melastoma candidum]|uniref:Uncharacterized protein n=1 Tax=Melastoma candidum TaxID=119954 RepID=A0ACB9QTL8_9MYRT|nr:hypothetical protein MLD38_018018 [Melastoma candidum]
MVGAIIGPRKATLKAKTFTGCRNLIRLLPTGTVFLFQFLNPVLTNNGTCDRPFNKYLSFVLIVLCGISCCLSCFTDSYKGDDEVVRYGIVTVNGLWQSTGGSSADLSSYKLRFGDFVHAVLSVVTFSVLALLDAYTVKCLYPSFETTRKTLMMTLPTVIGVVAGGVFMVFPNNRNGIGYLSS